MLYFRACVNYSQKFVVYVPKMPLRVEPMPSLNLCEPKRFHGSYLSGIAPGKTFNNKCHFWKARGEWKVIHWRSGSRPWTCVHAHGHDVDPIMEASCNNNYCLDIISSGICELILCNHGSYRIFSLIPFLGQVKVLVFCRSIHRRNHYFDLPSSITLRNIENIKELYRFLWVYI